MADQYEKGHVIDDVVGATIRITRVRRNSVRFHITAESNTSFHYVSSQGNVRLSNLEPPPEYGQNTRSTWQKSFTRRVRRSFNVTGVTFTVDRIDGHTAHISRRQELHSSIKRLQEPLRNLNERRQKPSEQTAHSKQTGSDDNDLSIELDTSDSPAAEAVESDDTRAETTSGQQQKRSWFRWKKS